MSIELDNYKDHGLAFGGASYFGGARLVGHSDNHTSSNDKPSLKTLEYQINVQKLKASNLYKEIENVRNRTNDITLSDISTNIIQLPKSLCQLKLYNTLRGHQGKITSTKWSQDSKKILSASQDGYMIIWDAVSGFKKQAISLENQYVLSSCFSPDGSLIASGGLDNACTIYKIKSHLESPVQSVFKGHSAYISECSFLDGHTLITASGDMTLKLWDVHKAVKTRDYTDHMGDVLTMDVGVAKFVSGGSDGFCKI